MSWLYRAIDHQGNETTAVLEVESELSAQTQLRQLGLHVLELRQYKQGSSADSGALFATIRYSAWAGVATNDLVFLFRQLSLMLRAGYTLIDSIKTASELSTKRRMQKLLDRVAKAIERGQSLSQVMLQVGRPFSTVMSELVASGEKSGELDLVLERMAMDLERSKELKRQLMMSLAYPVFVLLMAMSIVLYLVLSVVPKFESFLASRGKAIPWAAQTLVDGVHWFFNNGMTLGVWLGGLTIILMVLYRIPAARMMFDHALLKIPFVGACITSSSTARVFWTLSILLQSGMTVLNSLTITANTLDNRVQQKAILQASESILQGQSLGQALKSSAFPRLLAYMAMLGEKTGEVDRVIGDLGLYFQKDLEKKIKLMNLLIEPALIFIVGGIVGFVYFAFFQAVFTVSSR